ncbi:MAG: TolB family protein [Prosthecobacter sp.]
MNPAPHFLLAALGGLLLSSPIPAQEKAGTDAPATIPVGKLAYVTSADFGRAGNIWIMTGSVRTMEPTHQTRDFAFAAGGKKIVYTANDPVAIGLYLHDLEQHASTRLLAAADNVRGPDLSPDGTRIAFYQPGEESSQIMTAAVDGTDLKQLTQENCFNWTPRWSPDGRRLLFETTRNELPGGGEGGGQRDIYVMDADGKNQTNLTANSYGHSAAWSPDGKHIAYMNNGSIFIMNSDGSSKKDVSHGKVRDSEPAWSPDGQWIAFTRTHKNSRAMDIWIMKSDGTGQRQITFNEGMTASFSPQWSKE